MSELKIIDKETNFQNVYENIIDVVEEVPFGNSDFQNQKLMVNKEGGVLRGFRTAGLKILDKLNALKEAKSGYDKNEIEIERKNRKITKLEREKPEDYDLDIKLLNIEITDIENGYNYSKKLVKDAIAEINSLLPFFNSIGKVTKEQFELGEEEHFKNKLLENVLGKHESLKSLNSMGFDFVKEGEQVKLKKFNNNKELGEKDNILHIDQ